MGTPSLPDLRGGGGAVGVEGAGEFFGDGGRGGGLNRGALHEVDELAVAQNGDGRRGGRVSGEVATGFFRSVAVLSGEDGDGLGGFGSVLHGHADGGAHLSGGTAANGVDDEHSGAGAGEGGVDVIGRARFLNAGAGEFFAHGDEHDLWVHIVS